MANGEWGVYRGAVNLNNANDIQHWKYIKKYRVGDKWRYVYGDEKTHKTINNAHSNYLTTKENANRYKEAANKYDTQFKASMLRSTSGLLTNNSNSKTAANRYKAEYKQAKDNASINSRNSSRHYNDYVKSVENNSVSKILNDKIKSWKEKSNTFFNKYATITKTYIDKKKEEANVRKEDRKHYPVGLGTEIKNQIDYATHPSQWKQPYKSASTKKKEEYAAWWEENKKKHPINAVLVPKHLWR